MRHLFLCFILFASLLPWRVFASAPVSFEEDSTRIMVLSLEDNTVLTETLEVYPVLADWYMPMTILFEVLDFAITVSPALGQAEGFFIREENQFELDRELCQVKIKSTIQSYPCNGVVSYADELYVSHNLLKDWMGLEFTFNSYASDIVLKSKEPLPEQTRRSRLKQAPKQSEASTSGSDLPDNFGEHRMSDVDWGHFSLDQQLLLGVDDTVLLKKSRLRHDTAISMEVHGFETRAYLGGEGEETSEFLLNISKKDSAGGLLGPLGARSIEMLDVTLPGVPLVHSSVKVRGAAISNFPLSLANTFSTKEFRGPLAAGWEVELYQNDTLIGRRRTENGIEYEFKDVILFYGLNRFRLVFYGPQGQRKEKTEVVNVGQQAVQQGEHFYRVGLGKKSDLDNGELFSSQYRAGISPSVSAGLSYVGEETKGTQLIKRNYLVLDVAASFSRLYSSLNIAFDDESGSAIELSAQAPFEKAVLGLSRVEFSNFKSSLYNLQESRVLSSSSKATAQTSLYPFLPLRLDGEIEERVFTNGEKQSYLKHRTAIQIKSNFLFNTITQEIHGGEDVNGEALLLIPLGFNEIRTWVEYRKTADNIGAAVLTRWDDRLSSEFSTQKNFTSSLLTTTLSLNRRHQNFTWGAEVGVDDQGGYRAMGLFSYSLTQSPRSLSVVMDSHLQTHFGAASVRVFVDRNYNGIYDADDELLPNISLQVNHNEVPTKTDSKGEAMLLQLPAHSPVDVGISLMSLPDPMFMPKYQGIRVYPRPGQVALVDMPVVVFNEIDGAVILETPPKTRGVRGLSIVLRDLNGEVVRKVRTESDGFFLIEGLLPGDYVVELDSDELKRKRLMSNQTSFPVTIVGDRPIESSFEIKVFNDTKVRN